MNNILKVSLTVVVALILAGAFFFAGSVFSSFTFQRNMPMQIDRNQGNQNRGGQRQGGNMPGMNGGRMGQGQGDGRGMGMDGPGNGMRDDDMGRPGMGRNAPENDQATLTPVTTEEATKAAQDYITSTKVSGLEVGEVLIINSRAIVAVKETATGNGAFELTVSPRDKTAHPAIGIASAWNLKYGGILQTGMMTGRGPMMGQQTVTATPAANATPADVSAEMPITEAEAIKAAQTFLDAHNTGTTATTALKFYGYYSISITQDGKVIGKLSVNGYNGQVDGRP